MPDHALILLVLAGVIVVGVIASELHGRRRRPEISPAFARVLAGQVAAGLAVLTIESDLPPTSVGYRRKLGDVERVELARARTALMAIGTMVGNATPPDPVVGETLALAERSLAALRERPAER